MPRIRFLKKTIYDTNGPGLGPRYEAGEVVDVTPDVAERWFRRGAAVEVKDEPAASLPGAGVFDGLAIHDAIKPQTPPVAEEPAAAPVPPPAPAPVAPRLGRRHGV